MAFMPHHGRKTNPLESAPVLLIPKNSSHPPYLSNHCFHTWELHVVYIITSVPAPGPFVQTCVHRTGVRLGNFLTPVPLRSNEQRNREDIRIWGANLDFSLRT